MTVLGLQYFNPRSRMGSDDHLIQHNHKIFISIHAPAWGATIRFFACGEYGDISIHAPAWGATRWRHFCESPAVYFNPRSRMGSDILETLQRSRRIRISIHAPAWGATFQATKNYLTLMHFNPRSRMGSDAHISFQHKNR